MPADGLAPGPHCNIKAVFSCIGVIKIRQSHHSPIFIMGIPILVSQYLYIETPTLSSIQTVMIILMSHFMGSALDRLFNNSTIISLTNELDSWLQLNSLMCTLLSCNESRIFIGNEILFVELLSVCENTENMLASFLMGWDLTPFTKHQLVHYSSRKVTYFQSKWPKT